MQKLFKNNAKNKLANKAVQKPVIKTIRVNNAADGGEI